MPAHIEFDLPFLIERCGVTVPLAERRLNGLENVMTMLAKQWREIHPIAPARELRMSPATLNAYVRWVLGGEPANGNAAVSLDAYGRVVDVTVPEGWVRLLLSDRPDGVRSAD